MISRLLALVARHLVSFIKEGKTGGGIVLGLKQMNSVLCYVDFEVYVGQLGENVKETAQRY